jgi:predicted Zn finger-like uncharacterized protein
MIIDCICGLKKFEVEDNQISNNGRQVKCGVCSKEWFYKPESIAEESPTENFDNEETLDENFDDTEELPVSESSSDDLEINKELDYSNEITQPGAGASDYLNNKKKKNQSTRKRFLIYILIILIFVLSLVVLPYKGAILSIFPELTWYFEGFARINDLLFK